MGTLKFLKGYYKEYFKGSCKELYKGLELRGA